MKKRIQIYVLVALLMILVYAFFANRNGAPGVNGVLASDSKFVPLNVDEPELRLDLLANLKKSDYNGSGRNIFSAVAPPPKPIGPGSVVRSSRPPIGPQPLPPPPPVSVPGTLYGYAVMKDNGKRLAFFQEGEDVLVVEEGSEFLHGYRLIKVGPDSADVEELSSGRHATVQMTQPATASDPGGGGNNQ
jgi:hypothetical protein